MRILVLGAGVIGSVYAGKLLQAGHEVVLLAPGRRLADLQSHGSCFGDWGGIRVDALVSWGFLQHFAWTIDFDRRLYLFKEVNQEIGGHGAREARSDDDDGGRRDRPRLVLPESQ